MDSYVYIITALLPLAASMLVFQTNPYHALVIRGILGAIAALVYTVLGAADVALTEALVGTLLAITLYAVAVRSSLVLRLGVLQETSREAIAYTQQRWPYEVIDSAVMQDSAVLKDKDSAALQNHPFQTLLNDLQRIFDSYHMRVELVPYGDRAELHQALIAKEVHATCVPRAIATSDGAAKTNAGAIAVSYSTTTRLRRLYDIMHSEQLASLTHLSYLNPSESHPSAPPPSPVHSSNAQEKHS